MTKKKVTRHALQVLEKVRSADEVASHQREWSRKFLAGPFVLGGDPGEGGSGTRIPAAGHPRMGARGGAKLIGLGWMPDVPDLRDRRTEGKEFRYRWSGSALREVDQYESVDWSLLFSPVEDQEALGSCTAQAVVGILEFMMLRAPGGDGGYTDLSRLFLYKVTRRMLGWTGDTGAYIRSTIKAASAFGVPPEQYWPYDIDRFEVEPDAFLYSFAANFKALDYRRLDSVGMTRDVLLERIKLSVLKGHPVALGFPVYSSLRGGPDIPYPTASDRLEGGHAIAVVGWSDVHEFQDGEVGALIIRNSWGSEWGDAGYGYLPYRYVLDGLTDDHWAIFKSDWIASGEEGLAVTRRAQAKKKPSKKKK